MDETAKDSEHVQRRTAQLYTEQAQRMAAKTDKVFAVLMIVQWVVAVLFALVVSPRRWEGVESSIHVHVWTALVLGGAIAALPTYLALKHGALASTRYVVAVAQMLMSSLLIHLSGGRIETHFHVFGSLAFLAFYRDWKVLIPATVTIALDHLLRGLFFPQSVYGVGISTVWRTLEHAGWVLFEDAVLVAYCVNSQREMQLLAQKQARLEDVNENIESRVLLRTAELRDNEERFRTLVSGSPVALLQVDGQGSCLYANEHCLRMAGLSREELIGQSWTDALHPEDRSAAATLAANGGGAKEFRLKNGRARVSVGELATHGDGMLGRIIAMDKVA